MNMCNHVQLSNNLIEEDAKRFPAGTLIVYATMRLGMNNITRISYIGNNQICKALKIPPKNVREAIDALVEAEYLELAVSPSSKFRTRGFRFPETEFDKHFEMYTREFVEMDPAKLSWQIKDFYIRMQPYLFDKESGEGRCKLSQRELGEKLGMSQPTVGKYLRLLKEAGYIKEEKKLNVLTGQVEIMRTYDLTALEQARLWKAAVENAIIENAEATADLARRVAALEKRNAETEGKIAWMVKDNCRVKSAARAISDDKKPEKQLYEL